jgi:hypothetical protein
MLGLQGSGIGTVGVRIGGISAPQHFRLIKNGEAFSRRSRFSRCEPQEVPRSILSIPTAWNTFPEPRSVREYVEVAKDRVFVF